MVFTSSWVFVREDFRLISNFILMAKEVYNFDPSAFDRKDGREREEPSRLFHDFIVECERKFYSDHHPIAASHLKGSTNTMLLLQSCFDLDDEEFGMEDVDGEPDIETNKKIDEVSEKVMVFAIESSVQEKEGEPLFLLVDDELPDGQFILQHIPEGGDDGDEEYPEPVGKKEQYVRTY